MLEQIDHFLEGPALSETGSLDPEPASQGSGRGCENLARLQEEVCSLAGMEASEWAELKVDLLWAGTELCWKRGAG